MWAFFYFENTNFVLILSQKITQKQWQITKPNYLIFGLISLFQPVVFHLSSDYSDKETIEAGTTMN
ncbi:hypothetical protein PM8797T_13877 [Gimesia maris DSM 8797]|nr:hypothetical protein PM8797T_13877 [Gimesia maris DSM 8797]